MNIKKLSSFLFQRSVIVALLILLQAVVLLVPMSGNGALALLEDIMNTYGPDSYIARCASTIAGASETIFYISAVYFTKCKVKRLRYAIPVALFGSFCGMVIACALCRVM